MNTIVILTVGIYNMLWLVGCVVYLSMFRNTVKSIFVKSFWDTFFNPNVLLIQGTVIAVSVV